MPAKSSKKILFVSHAASRSGAPILLLEIIKAVSLRQNMPFYILCMEDGDLVTEFKKLGETFVWKIPQQPAKKLFRYFYAANHRVKQYLHSKFILRKVKKTNLIFYNTIVNEAIQNKLSFIPCKSICYVHELEAAIHQLTSPAGREFMLRNTSLFLCVSHAVKNNLIVNHNLSMQKAQVVATPASETYRDKQQYAGYVQKFKSFYKTGNAVIIGITANNEWRKGFDWLVPLTTLYFNSYPDADVFFVWKGFNKNKQHSFFDMFDYDRCKYKNRILLLPHDNESIEQMASYDIHLLLSREDPYPLVVLEAASFGVPTVCFAGAGGTPEFTEDDCGVAVPYADLQAMAKQLYLLATNSDLRVKTGSNCREKLLNRHNKKEALNVITDVIAGNMVI